MTDILARLAVGMLTKLITERFLSKILVYSLSTWSRQTENDWDDKVTKAVAEAFGVETSLLLPEEKKS